jgi:hypothetical protein
VKNAPALAEAGNPLPVFRSSSILVVESPDRTAWQAMSLEAADTRWQKLTFPPGITASPVIGGDTMALILKGETIDHVAAFSVHTGEWSKQHLLKPVAEQITPAVGAGCALYQAGNDFYAFGALKGTWGVLHLEGDEKAKAALSPQDIEVLQGNRLYVFSLKQGVWSKGVEINLQPFRLEPRRAEPAR